MKRLKIVTVLGTRPEIIRLSSLIPLLDRFTDHHLVHTGQNYSPELSQIFFDELSLREPDIYLNARQASLGAQLGSMLEQVEAYLQKVQPDGVVILGDTNSALSAIIAERLKFPVFHLEAGNRSFDKEVPEELNRKLVDHISSFNLCYTETARRNLLSEGLHPNSICVTGSPLTEVIQNLKSRIEGSEVLNRLGLEPGNFLLVSAHRQETVDNPERLGLLMKSLVELGERSGKRVIVSTHPRTQSKLDAKSVSLPGVELLPPFGFTDFLRLQKEAAFVFSDSGSLSEEASILGFKAATIRNSFERQEGLDVGLLATVGLVVESWLTVMEFSTSMSVCQEVAGYSKPDFSRTVLNFMFAKLIPLA
jgi:UDP-N-acetylglucosamine 2-epimerase (non-hydrolysing)